MNTVSICLPLGKDETFQRNNYVFKCTQCSWEIRARNENPLQSKHWQDLWYFWDRWDWERRDIPI